MDEKQLLWLLLAIPVILLYRSTGDEPIELWRHQSDAIELRYQADSGLNSFNSRPHTLVVVVYQLSDPVLFEEKCADQEGLHDLLSSRRFDSSVVAISRTIVQPGEHGSVVLDRVANAKWIGIVTGYQSIRPGAVDHLIRIPVTTKVSGWLRKKETKQIDNLFLMLDLGPESLSKVEISNEQ